VVYASAQAKRRKDKETREDKIIVGKMMRQEWDQEDLRQENGEPNFYIALADGFLRWQASFYATFPLRS